MELLLFFTQAILLTLCIIGSIAFFVFAINQLMAKKFQNVFNSVVAIVVLIIIFNNTSAFNNKLVQKDIITKEVISTNYVSDIQHIQTKSSGYNNYRLLNTSNGGIIKLQETDFVKLKCDNYNVISYNILREYTLVGIKFDFETDGIEYKVNCIKD